MSCYLDLELNPNSLVRQTGQIMKSKQTAISQKGPSMIVFAALFIYTT